MQKRETLVRMFTCRVMIRGRGRVAKSMSVKIFMLLLNRPMAVKVCTHTFTAIGLFNSSINIFTDILFATLPLPLIITLQVNMRTKVSLFCIISLGYFACAASIVKTYYQTKVLSDPDSIRN